MEERLQTSLERDMDVIMHVQDIVEKSPEVQQSIEEAHELLSRGKAQVEKLEAEELRDQQLATQGQQTITSSSLNVLPRWVPLYIALHLREPTQRH